MERTYDLGPKLDVETKIKLLIVLINDEGKTKLDQSMTKLCNRVLENIENSHFIIRKFLIESILYLPIKTEIYCNFLNRLYHKSSKSRNIKMLIEEIFLGLNYHLQNEDSIESSDNNIAIRYIKFIFESFKNDLITFESIKYFIDNVLNRKIDDQDKEVYIYLITINLPFIKDELIKFNNEYYCQVNEMIEKYSQTHSNKFYERYGKAMKSSQHNYIFQMINNSKIFKTDSKLLLNLSKENLEKNEKLNLNIDIKLSSHLIHKIYSQYIYTENFPIFENFKSNIDRSFQYLCRNYIEEIIFGFHDKIELAIQYINNLPKFFGIDDITHNEMYSNIEISTIDTIFHILMQLNSPVTVTYISSLIFHLGKSNISRQKITMDYIEIILKNISNFDVHCVETFANFLSFYIPNLQYKFNISLLNTLYEKKENIKIHLFLKMMFEKLYLVGGRQRMEELLKNDSLLELIPFKEKPNWKFIPSEQFYFDTELLIDYIHTKREFSSWTEKFESTGNDFCYVLLSCIFYCRSKTLSHLRESLIFYLDAIKSIVINKDRQIVVLTALFDIWGNSHIYIKFIMEFLLNNTILEHSTLIKYIFENVLYSDSKDNIKSQLSNWANFEMIHLSIIHSEKLLKRFRLLLLKEQENLLNCEESSQHDIIKLIEYYETCISKLNSESDILPIEIVKLYCNLFNIVKESNDKRSYIFERIVQMCRNFKLDVMRNLNCFKTEKESEIEFLLNNLKNI